MLLVPPAGGSTPAPPHTSAAAKRVAWLVLRVLRPGRARVARDRAYWASSLSGARCCCSSPPSHSSLVLAPAAVSAARWGWPQGTVTECGPARRPPLGLACGRARARGRSLLRRPAARVRLWRSHAPPPRRVRAASRSGKTAALGVGQPRRTPSRCARAVSRRSRAFDLPIGRANNLSEERRRPRCEERRGGLVSYAASKTPMPNFRISGTGRGTRASVHEVGGRSPSDWRDSILRLSASALYCWSGGSNAGARAILHGAEATRSASSQALRGLGAASPQQAYQPPQSCCILI